MEKSIPDPEEVGAVNRWAVTANMIDVIKSSAPQPLQATSSSLWHKNRVLASRDPKLFWYFLGIVGIFLQIVFMLSLAIWQLKKIYDHDYIDRKTGIAVASLFLLFALYLVVNMWQTWSRRSRTLGGVLCCEILFLPVTYYLSYLFQSYQFLISLGFLVTIIVTIPLFFLRARYCEQHRKLFAE